MPELSDMMYCSQQICIPPSFPYLLRQYAKAAIRCQPSDLLKWSTAYFRCLSLNLPPPVKPRLEYPVPKSYFGMTPGWLKALMYQMMTTSTVTYRVLWDRWQGACLETHNLIQMLLLGGFTDNQAIPWRRFVALCAAHLTDSLTRTMILICEILTEEPEGGSAIIPLEIFLDLYQFLANIDASQPQKLRNLYFTDEALELVPKELPEESVAEEESEESAQAVEATVVEEVSEEHVEEEQLDVVISCPDLVPSETTLAKEEDVKYGSLALNRSAGFLPVIGKLDGGEVEESSGGAAKKPDILHTTDDLMELQQAGDTFSGEEGGEGDEDDDDVKTEDRSTAAPSAVPEDIKPVSTDEANEVKTNASQPFVVSETEKMDDDKSIARSEVTVTSEKTEVELTPTVGMTESTMTAATLDVSEEVSALTTEQMEYVKSTATVTGRLETAAELSSQKSSVTMISAVVDMMTSDEDGEDEEGDYVGICVAAKAELDDTQSRPSDDELPREEIIGEMSGEGSTKREMSEISSTGTYESEQCLANFGEPVGLPEEAEKGDLVDVHAVPGIGPKVPEHMVKAVCEYMRDMASRQHGMVMPMNIIHYSCPPLEELVE